jgi:hypothetical protein
MVWPGDHPDRRRQPVTGASANYAIRHQGRALGNSYDLISAYYRVPVIGTDHRSSVASAAIPRLGFAAHAARRQSPPNPIPMSPAQRD